VEIESFNGAYAYFEEHLKGSITEGKLADLEVLDRDPIQGVDPMTIKDIPVARRIIEGETMYEA